MKVICLTGCLVLSGPLAVIFINFFRCVDERNAAEVTKKLVKKEVTKKLGFDVFAVVR